jgi:DNA topoisomerase I
MADDTPTPEEVARAAGLSHVSDEDEGIRRVRRGRGFSYHAPSGELITDDAARERFSALAIPPAWTKVWICPDPDGHIQATGRDAEGRKQYRYHPEWTARTARNKFGSMREFGSVLPRIRRRVRRDLGREGLPREKILAVLVRLLDLTGLRIGSETSRGTNASYGLTTLRRKHVVFQKGGARLRFRGKGGAVQEVGLADDQLAGILQACYDVPGHELFQYLDSAGARHAIDSSDVNDYIRSVSRADVTARDFRTWLGSIQALEAMERLPAPEHEGDRQKALAEVLDVVAETLHNTPAVCREFYVHPALVEAYLGGRLAAMMSRASPRKVRELRRSEARFLALVE